MKTSGYLLGIYISIAVCITLFAGCGKSRKTYREEIKIKEKQWEEKYEIETGRMLVSAYFAYQEKYPSDTLSASYLRRAAYILEFEQNYPEAISTMELIMEKYPKYRKINEVYATTGRLYQEVDDIESARKVYNTYLEHFPNDSAAYVIQLLRDNLGKPQKEIKENLLSTPDTVK